MLSLTPSRGRQSAILVLILAISVLAFAAWLKISPSLASDYRPEASQLTKLWVDPTQAWETLIKLVPVEIILFFVVPVLCLFVARDWSWQSNVTPRSAARDIFAESRHWFRPPPLI